MSMNKTGRMRDGVEQKIKEPAHIRKSMKGIDTPLLSPGRSHICFAPPPLSPRSPTAEADARMDYSTDESLSGWRQEATDRSREGGEMYMLG